MEKIKIARYESPIGGLMLGSHADRLCFCYRVTKNRQGTAVRRVCRSLGAEYEEGMSGVTARAIAELDEYFAGRRTEFDVPLAFTGTPFQCAVWSDLMKIPYGTTITYAEQARRIGNPKALRAVGMADASNPLLIFVPCHRVVGSNNRLTGYAGGLDAKEALLALEARFPLIFTGIAQPPQSLDFAEKKEKEA